MENGYVSIIVPVYKAERYLAGCIESILQQTYGDFELLLIVDGSPDNSAQICRQYEKQDSRIRVIEKENEGVAATRNLGISLAKGDYVAFVDSDDTITEDYLEKLLTAAVESNAQFAICGICQQTKEGILPFTEGMLLPYSRDKDDLYDRHIRGLFRIDRAPYFMGTVCRSVISRKCLEDNKIRLPICKILEDQLFVLSLLSVIERMAVVNEPMYIYNQINEGSALQILWKKNYLADQLVYWEGLKLRLEQLPITEEQKKTIYYYGLLDVRKRLLTNAAMCAEAAKRKRELQEIYDSQLYEESVPLRLYLRWWTVQPPKTIAAELLIRMHMYNLLRKLRGG